MDKEMKVAVLMTVHNRRDITLRCLDSLCNTLEPFRDRFQVSVFLTDDGCTDGTSEAIRERAFPSDIHLLQGDGSLYWNGGMINSWKTALSAGKWDGFLWLNDDVIVLPAFWEDLAGADAYSLETYGKKGIYVGSTQDIHTGEFTYGGFNYSSKFLLKDQFVRPDGTYQTCEAAHGNITYVSSEVVEKKGIFCEKYIHGGTDHEYTYLAHKAGFPVLVMPHYAAACENDHPGKAKKNAEKTPKSWWKLFWSPWGYNMHNTLLFNWHCFPWRVPFVFVATLTKSLFPRLGYTIYRRLRGVK